MPTGRTRSDDPQPRGKPVHYPDGTIDPMNKPRPAAAGNAPSCVLIPIVGWTTTDGALHHLRIEPPETIAETEPLIAAAVLAARASGHGVCVRFCSLASGRCVSLVRVV